MSKKGLVSEIIEENVAHYCDNLTNFLSTEEKLMPGTGSYKPVMNSVIWRIVTGEFTTYTDPRFAALIETMKHLIEGVKSSTWRKLLIRASSFMIKIFAFFDAKEIVPIVNMQQVADEMIQQGIVNDNNNLTNRYMTSFEHDHRMIRGLVLDMFFAAIDTTSHFIEWAVLHLVMYPVVQEKAFQEIRATIGLDRSPKFADHKNTPYCQAVIEEIMRVCAELDLNVAHLTMEDTHALGYDFPKGTQVIGFQGGHHRVEKNFDNPTQFEPTRHIHNGAFKHHESIHFFGIGKRRCAGEVLAKEQVYIFLANLIQKFKFRKLPNVEMNLKPRYKFVLIPAEYDMLVSCRK